MSISNGIDGDRTPDAADGAPAEARWDTSAGTRTDAHDGPPQDPVADALLDAAYQCIAAFGLRRLTLTDVARRAGVSRPTVYRRWRDIHTLVADLLTREMHAAVQAAAAPYETPPAAAGGVRERLVRQSAGVFTALRGHPLLVRILETEPEALVTYTFQRLGSSQREVLAQLLPLIEAGQADGSVREGDPAALARMVMLQVQTMTQSWRLLDDVLPLDLLAAELRHLLDAYLRPVEPVR